MQILQKLIVNDRDENQGDAHNFLTGPSINVAIRRNYIYEDAYDKLSPDNGKLTDRIPDTGSHCRH